MSAFPFAVVDRPHHPLILHVQSADDLRDHIPGDIIFEGIAAFLIASFGYISSHGVFENIHKKKINEEKSFDQFHYRPNFMVCYCATCAPPMKVGTPLPTQLRPLPNAPLDCGWLWDCA